MNETNPRRVVALHGFTGRGSDWAGLGGRLGAWVFAPDLPGHGPDADPVGSFDQTVDALVERARAAGFGRAVWVGYSLGGRLALAAALRAPEAVEALVLIGASAGIAEDDARHTRRLDDEALAERLERDGVGPFLEAWDRLPLLRSRPARTAAARRHQAAGLAAALRRLGRGIQTPARTSLGRVRCPTLLVAGARDRKHAAIAAHLEAEIALARVELIPSAGHVVPAEAPGPLAASIDAFLDDAAATVSVLESATATLPERLAALLTFRTGEPAALPRPTTA